MSTFNYLDATAELYLILDSSLSDSSGRNDPYLSPARQMALWRLMYHRESQVVGGPSVTRSATVRETVIYRRLLARLRLRMIAQDRRL